MASRGSGRFPDYFPWQCLYFLPLPQGHGSFRPTLGWLLTTCAPRGLLASPIGEPPPRAPPPKAAAPKEPMLLWFADCAVATVLDGRRDCPSPGGPT